MALIELDDVRRVYDLGEVKVHALRTVTKQIELGEYVALIGPSGSGKRQPDHECQNLETCYRW